MYGVLSHWQLDRIDSAEVFAAEKHRHQVRKDGSPYTEHIRRVAATAAAWALRRLYIDAATLTDLWIAGLCHDLVEDQGVTFEELETRFSKSVTELVGWVSNRKDIEDQYERLQEYCSRLRVAPQLAAMLKLADLYDNANSRPPSARWAANWAGKKAPVMLEAIQVQVGVIPEYIRVKEAIDRMRRQAEDGLSRELAHA